YSLETDSLVQIDNISKPGATPKLEPECYLNSAAALFPSLERVKWKGGYRLNSLFGFRNHPVRQLSQKDYETLLLPLTLQQDYLFRKSDQHYVNASFSKETYTISVSQTPIQIFIVLSLVILVWCLSLLFLSGLTRT